MSEPQSQPASSTRWCAMAMELLSSENPTDRESILEFLSCQSRPEEADADKIFPMISENLLHPETQVRYHARKARDHFLSLFPALARDSEIQAASSQKKNGENGDQGDVGSPISGAAGIATREILLRKLRLGSRYIAFEAIERLTDSRDPELAGPLIDFLAADRDPFKISFLLKRLSRISHPRIPGIIEGYLDHPDPRIVANALEGLAECDVPDLKETFSRLAESRDNRIRANAVRALYRYDKVTATLHIEEMLGCNSVALQDSGVYLLGTLRPEKTDELLERALASKFTTVRMRALEIPRMLAGTGADRRRLNDSRLTTRSDLSSFHWLGAFLFLGLVQLLVWPTPPSILPIGLSLVGLLLLFLSWHQPRHTTFPSIGASLLFLAALSTGTSGVIPLLGFMLIWLGLPTADLPANARRTRVFAWLWAGLGAVFVWQFGGEIGRLMTAIATFPIPSGAESIVVELIGQQQRFTFTYFSFVAVGAFILAWFGRKEYPEGQASPSDHQIMTALGGGIVVMIVLQLAFGFGVRAMMSLRGVPNVLSLPPLLIQPQTPPTQPATASSTTPQR